MKKTNTVGALMLAILPLATQALAQDPTPLLGTVSKVTISLTLTTTVAGTVAKDSAGKPIKKGQEGAGPAFYNEWTVTKGETTVAEVEEYVSKMVTSKYSNKEFLLDLVKFGVIEDIKGWSVVKVQASLPYTETEGEEPDEVVVEQSVEPGMEKLYLINKDTTIDPISLDSIADYGFGPTAQAVTSKTETLFVDGEPSYPVKLTWAAKFVGNGGFGIGFEMEVIDDNETPEDSEDDIIYDVEKGLQAGGTYTGGYKLATFGSAKAPIIIAEAGKLDSLSGNFFFEDEQEEIYEYGHLAGSISFSAGTPQADVSKFEGIDENPEWE